MSTKAVVPATPAVSKPVTPTPAAAIAAHARKGRKPVDPNETPEKTFVRLCEPRVVKVLKAAKQLRNLGRFNPNDAQRNKVFSTIKEAINLAESAWVGTVAPEAGFKL